MTVPGQFFPYDGRFNVDYEPPGTFAVWLCLELAGVTTPTPVTFAVPSGPGFGGFVITKDTGEGTGLINLAAVGWDAPSGNPDTHTYTVTATVTATEFAMDIVWHHQPEVGFVDYGTVPILLEGTVDPSGMVSLNWTPQPLSYQNLPYRRIGYSLERRPYSPLEDLPWTSVGYLGAALSTTDGPITVPTEYRVLGQEAVIERGGYSNLLLPADAPLVGTGGKAWGRLAR